MEPKRGRLNVIYRDSLAAMARARSRLGRVLVLFRSVPLVFPLFLGRGFESRLAATIAATSAGILRGELPSSLDDGLSAGG